MPRSTFQSFKDKLDERNKAMTLRIFQTIRSLLSNINLLPFSHQWDPLQSLPPQEGLIYLSFRHLLPVWKTTSIRCFKICSWKESKLLWTYSLALYPTRLYASEWSTSQISSIPWPWQLSTRSNVSYLPSSHLLFSFYVQPTYWREELVSAYLYSDKLASHSPSSLG